MSITGGHPLKGPFQLHKSGDRIDVIFKGKSAGLIAETVFGDVKGYKKVNHSGGIDDMMPGIARVSELKLAIILLTNEAPAATTGLAMPPPA